MARYRLVVARTEDRNRWQDRCCLIDVREHVDLEAAKTAAACMLHVLDYVYNCGTHTVAISEVGADTLLAVVEE